MTFVLGYHLKSARQIVDNVNGFASIEMKAYLKSLLRPYVGKRLRALLLRARGIRNETFAHETVAALVERKDPAILDIGCNDGSDSFAQGQLTLNRLLARLPEFEVVVRYPGDILLRNKRFITGGCGNRSEKWDISVS